MLNVGVHRKIMNHLNEKFVNLPGITTQIRQKRQKQNDWHFYGSIIFSTCRLVSVLPLVILCLLPPEIMGKQEGFVLYFTFHWISSVYETCGVSLFFISSYVIFNNRNMGKPKESLRKTIRGCFWKICLTIEAMFDQRCKY